VLTARQGQITNILEENVLQPLLVNTSAIELATETVSLLLRIDGASRCGEAQRCRTDACPRRLPPHALSVLRLGRTTGDCVFGHGHARREQGRLRHKMHIARAQTGSMWR